MLNPSLVTGIIIVNFALIFYTAAVIIEFRTRKVTFNLLIFFTAGVIMDITSTVFMIIGSRRIPITPHGFMGYAALTAMALDAFFLWRNFVKKGAGSAFTAKGHVYSSAAYFYWIAAYAAGVVIIALHAD